MVFGMIKIFQVDNDSRVSAGGAARRARYHRLPREVKRRLGGHERPH